MFWNTLQIQNKQCSTNKTNWYRKSWPFTTKISCDEVNVYIPCLFHIWKHSVRCLVLIQLETDTELCTTKLQQSLPHTCLQECYKACRSFSPDQQLELVYQVVLGKWVIGEWSHWLNESLAKWFFVQWETLNEWAIGWISHWWMESLTE